jgi:hypothetical protein
MGRRRRAVPNEKAAVAFCEGLATIAAFVRAGIACPETPTFQDLKCDEARHADYEIGGSFDQRER